MKNHKVVYQIMICFKRIKLGGYRCVFSLLKIITKLIIKAMAIIVTLTNPKNSSLVIIRPHTN